MFHDVSFLKSVLLKTTSFSPLRFMSPETGLAGEAEGHADSVKKIRRKVKVQLSITPLLAGLLAACSSDTEYIPVYTGSTTPGGTPGTTFAQGVITNSVSSEQTVMLTAKSPGSEGNKIQVVFTHHSGFSSGSASVQSVTTTNDVITITIISHSDTNYSSNTLAQIINNDDEAGELVSAVGSSNDLISNKTWRSSQLSGGSDGADIVHTVTAILGEQNIDVVYALSGGPDAHLFGIDAATGDIWFRASPDYDSPVDDGGDNIYNFTVTATAGDMSVTQDVALTVSNVNEDTTGSLSVTANSPVLFSFTGNITDPDDATPTLAYGYYAFGDEDNVTEASNPANVVINVAGFYVAQVTVTDDVFDTATIFKSDVFVAGTPVGEVTVTQGAGNADINDVGDTLSVTLTGVGGTGLELSYQWYRDGTKVGDNTSTYVADAAGDYTVEITVAEVGQTFTSEVTAIAADNAAPVIGLAQHSASTVDVDGVTVVNLDDPTSDDYLDATTVFDFGKGVTGLTQYSEDGDFVSWDFEVEASDSLSETVAWIRDLENHADTATRAFAARVTAILTPEADGDAAINTAIDDVDIINDMKEYTFTGGGVLDTSVTAGSDTAASGGVTLSDAETDAWDLTVSISNGTYGTAAVTHYDTYANWTYSLDDTNPAVQALRGDETLTDTISITVTDGDGGQATRDVNITIHGANNTAPTLSAIAGTVSIAEDATFAADTDSGLSFTASDSEDTLSAASFAVFEGTSESASTRFIVVADSGVTNGWKIQVISGASFDHETDGGTITLKVVVTDSDGARAEQSVNVTLTNVNDTAPSITSGATGTALAENAEVSTSTPVYTAAGTYDVTPIVWSLKGDDAGLFDIDAATDDAELFDIDAATGAVTFKAATTPDYESQASYSFTVMATSGDLTPVEQAVTIAVTNVNEAPYIGVSSDVAASVTEDSTDSSDSGTAVTTVTGSLDVWDVEADADAFAVVEVHGLVFTSTIAGEAGDNAVGFFAATTTYVSQYQYGRSDLIVDIGPKNASITLAALLGILDPDGDGVVDGTGGTETTFSVALADGASGTDVFNRSEAVGYLSLSRQGQGGGLTLTVALKDGSPDLGDFIINDDGDWSFTLDATDAELNAAWNAANNSSGETFDAGDTLNVVYTVSISDGENNITTQDITITVNGADETPTNSTPTGEVWTGTAGDDVKDGTAGDDTLDGGAGNDTINGLAGDDTITGGAGIDLLTGGDGRNVFVLGLDLAEGDYDIITDFAADDDARVKDQIQILNSEASAAVGYSVIVEPDNDNNLLRLTASTIETNDSPIVRWTEDSDESAKSIAAGSTTNDANVNDTVFWHTNFTADTGDDWILLILEDYTSLQGSNLDIV